MFTDLRRYIADLLFLLGKEKRELPLILASFFVVALLDVAGLAVVGGYIALLTESDIAVSRLLATLASVFKLADNDYYHLSLGMVLIAIFVIKAVTAILIQHRILRFAAFQGVILRTRLSGAILRMPYEGFTSRNSSEYVEALLGHVGQYSLSLVSLLRLTAEGVIAVSLGLMLLVVNGATDE